jgi:molybdopterin-guanine dinucleotide biosynthesis protein
MMRATIVSISGFSSEVGKTTILCELLRLLPGWEAIKVTRGHYRSCGKGTDSCCVAPLLGEKPLVLSSRQETCVPGKDTGRYWQAGAGRVHWVIGVDEQIEEGIRIALGRVEREGVFVEGGSFLKYVKADYSVMVASPAIKDIKSSAVRVLPDMDALIINRAEPDLDVVTEINNRLLKRGAKPGKAAVYFERELPSVVEEIRRIHRARFPSPQSYGALRVIDSL